MICSVDTVAATGKYGIPAEAYPLVAHLHRDLKASLRAMTSEEWSIMLEQASGKRTPRRSDNQHGPVTPRDEKHSRPVITVRQGDQAPPWNSLPLRVKRLLGGLAMLASDPALCLARASYADLQLFVLGSRSQVPQTLKKARELGVLQEWARANVAGSGPTVYLFTYYPEALAMGLALALGVEVSVATVNRLLEAGLSPREVRFELLSCYLGMEEPQSEHAFTVVETDLHSDERANVGESGWQEVVFEDNETYPWPTDLDYVDPESFRVIMDADGNIYPVEDVPKCSKHAVADSPKLSTGIHNEHPCHCGQLLLISTAFTELSTGINSITQVVSPHCRTGPTTTTPLDVKSLLAGDKRTANSPPPNPAGAVGMREAVPVSASHCHKLPQEQGYHQEGKKPHCCSLAKWALCARCPPLSRKSADDLRTCQKEKRPRGSASEPCGLLGDTKLDERIVPLVHLDSLPSLALNYAPLYAARLA